MVTAPAPFPSDEIRTLLRERYPGLAFVETRTGRSAQGVYDLMHDGMWLGSYLLRIDLLEPYPFVIPVVRETGERIPKTDDYHLNADGSLCLGVPEELWIELSGRFELRDVIDGPLRTFLLGMTNKLDGRDWPYGERAHGALGICDYYARFIGSADPVHVLELLQMLTSPTIKGHWICPCGSNRELRKCHGDAIRKLHAHGIPSDMLRRSGAQIAAHIAKQLDEHRDELEKIRGLLRRLDLLPPPDQSAVKRRA